MSAVGTELEPEERDLKETLEKRNTVRRVHEVELEEDGSYHASAINYNGEQLQMEGKREGPGLVTMDEKY